jgi:phosphoglycerol transferase MdoB-like AlkP superfamily enzyme
VRGARRTGAGEECGGDDSGAETSKSSRGNLPSINEPVPTTVKSYTRAFGWGLTLLVVGVGAKLVLIGLRVIDDGRTGISGGWGAIAVVTEDLRLASLFGAFAFAVFALAGARRGAEATVAALFAALAIWIAANLPIARLLSLPLTYGFLHATGSALGDSIARYATLPNIGLPLIVIAGGLAFARWVRPRVTPGRRALLAIAAGAAVLLALGPIAVRRSETAGLYRNAVLALVETAGARWLGGRRPPRPPLASPACRADDGGPAAALSDLAGIARERSVVWVILESVGARALPMYGNPRDAAPELTALAHDAVVFDRAYTAYPESIKGLFSILCSREPPPGTEASDYAVGRIGCVPIAEEMARAGYRTGLFHSGWFVYLGMRAVVEARGFDELRDAATIASPHRSSFGVDDRATADALLAFVDSLPAGQRFFAVFMPIAGHHPYHAPGVAPRPFAETNDAGEYANDVRVADDAFGRVRAGLRARKLDDRVVYVVVGDHGEAFREHPANIAHALFIYEENVRVPFFVAAPGATVGARRAPALASLLDLAPTTLALAGVRVPQQYEGQSLLAATPRVARFATEQGRRWAGVRDGRWKVIVDEESGRGQLYDLEADPGERKDLAGERGEIVARYRGCVGR